MPSIPNSAMLELQCQDHIKMNCQCFSKAWIFVSIVVLKQHYFKTIYRCIQGHTCTHHRFWFTAVFPSVAHKATCQIKEGPDLALIPMQNIMDKSCGSALVASYVIHMPLVICKGHSEDESKAQISTTHQVLLYPQGNLILQVRKLKHRLKNMPWLMGSVWWNGI